MTPEIEALEREIEGLKERLAEARLQAPREEVADFVFQTLSGSVKMSDLFGSQDELIIIHNMGKGCPYCTLWADGFNGQTEHFENRASFVIVSPDSPDVQRDFAMGRGWTFRMVSDSDKSFSTAMGYWTDQDGWWPGVSTFVRDGGKIYRTGKAVFGPGDDFCAIWPIQDLLGGPKGWEPKNSY